MFLVYLLRVLGGKYGVMPWGLAPGSLGKYVLVCIVSFRFAEALLYNKQ